MPQLKRASFIFTSPHLVFFRTAVQSATFSAAFVAAFLLSGCVTGPFTSYESAHTVGHKIDEIMGGYGTSGYVFKWNRGITNQFDLGLQLERLSVGLRAKYAFVQASQGMAFALAGGAGASGNGAHFYGDAMVSDRIGNFEPYTTFRFTHVTVDELKFHDKNNGNVIARIDAAQFDYAQLFLGTRYWINMNWNLSAEFSYVLSLGAVHFDDKFLASAAFGYHF